MDFNKLIGIKKPVFVIAEIGQNHQGDITTAKKLIRIAKECGADCVKFQKTCLEEKFTRKALGRPYTSENSWGATYGEHKSYLEFSNEQFIELQQHAKDTGILFSASAMDSVSMKFLVNIKVPFIKIGSGDANNFLLIEEAASVGVPLIVSTGMQNFTTVQEIYGIISKYHKKFAFLHCVSSYPTPVDDINLRVLQLYQETFPDIAIGYSGHELGTLVSTVAVALGASIIERHITLDKTYKGSDHKCSLSPSEFKKMIEDINTVLSTLGKPVKEIKNSEIECYRKLGKSIVASKNISKGTMLTKEHLKIKVSQPPGMDGSLIRRITGLKIIKDITADQPLTEDYLEKS